MIYAGTSTTNDAPLQTGSGTMINNGAGYTYSPDGATHNNKYVGFQYVDGIRNGHKNNTQNGIVENSNVLNELNNWFKNNLIDELNTKNSYIDINAGFCNDRTTYANTDLNSLDNSLGTGIVNNNYGSSVRNAEIWTGKSKKPASPTFICLDQDNDLFTSLNSSKGNTSLDYPVGLITNDESYYAGGLACSYNEKYYLNNGANYWTMSPAYVGGGSNAWAYVFIVDNIDVGSCLANMDVYRDRGIRPVINLKPGSLKFGEGTAKNPYKTTS